ncbi:MAG: hypothetical protein FJ320_00100 [SAR202 cluster bacterium]|nr:hypothetical protein [SAR202 cluster bacterium]
MDNNTSANTPKTLTRRRVLGITLLGAAGLAVMGTALKGLPGFLKRNPAPADGPTKDLPQDSIFQPRQNKKS